MLVCPRCSAPCGETHSYCFSCGAELEQAPPEDPLLGRTLPGGYRVTHLVGVGGMGRVYCAEQVALGRTVAVKVVHPHLADDELAAARFLNEARTASRLSHPHSVAIFDFGRTEEGQPYIVMEYLRGRDLARVAHDEGPLPIRRTADVLRQTLAALDEAHALGIVHRDLKPDNIVLEPLRSGSDFVKVVDFGLAKILEEAPTGGGRGALTRPGLVCGTPEYMSPEQGRGDPLDGRADLYSLGIVLFEVLTGRMPFVGDTPTKTLLMHLNDPAPDPRAVAPERGISEAFARLTLRALAKSREDRFQTARDFAEALDHALVESTGRLFVDTTPTTSIRCRACGALNALGQKFCGECGSQISTSSPPARRKLHSSSPEPSQDVAGTSTGPTMARGPAVGGGTHSLPLTARVEALDWLESRRHEAEASFALAHIVGEAGAGKTRLAREFGARCASRGDVVVNVGPDPAWAKIRDHAVRCAIAALLGVADGAPLDPEAVGATGVALRGLHALTGRHDPPTPADRRRDVAEALRWALARADERAGQGLVVVVVDDIDFLDGSSRNAFVDVTADPPPSGGLLVVTYAPGTSPVEPLEGEAWTLTPLPAEAFAHLLPERWVEDGAPRIPLHVEQLIAWARESKEPPPDRIADVIARRAERLPPDARYALHALAVLGDDATAEALKVLLPQTVDLGAALDALDKARLIAIDERGLRIAHPLVRRVVASTIPAGRKRDLFARAYDTSADAPLEVRARQAMHGGSAFEALSLLEVVSARRAAAGDGLGCVSALRHALDVTRRELHRGEIDDPVGAMLVFARKLAEALAASGLWNDAEGVLREGLGNAPPTSEHRARLLGALARVAQARRHPDDARRYVAEAMRVARQSDAGELLPLLQQIESSIEVA